jgi:uncharacterized protein (TIGR02246 family)
VKTDWTPADETAVRTLYQQLLTAWNERSAERFAALFAEDGSMVGFDGSVVNGRASITEEIGQIFANHMTATYVGKVREVRFLGTQAALLRAVGGMVPRGQTDINPAVNAIQTLVASWQEGLWRIAMYQNTPAQFHGRPELAQQLTDELRRLLKPEE